MDYQIRLYLMLINIRLWFLVLRSRMDEIQPKLNLENIIIIDHNYQLFRSLLLRPLIWQGY